MTSIFTPTGEYIPVTVLKVGPCPITQIKTKPRDGYNALQLGFEKTKETRINKPLHGHLKKSRSGALKVLREFDVDEPDSYRLGQVITLDIFKRGELVQVVGVIKGRGFSGVIKRHGFHGGKKTHGSHSHRIPGSIGCSAWPAKVIKGKKMPGRYGNTRQTTRNLEIVDIRPDQHLIMVKGAVPGCKSGLVSVMKAKFAA